MKLEEMAVFLREYEKAVSKTDVYRYTNTVKSVSDWPDIFGMNFGAILPAPPEEQAKIYLAQEQRANLLRRLMDGREVDDSAMLESYGFTSKELAAYRNAQDPVKKPIPSNLCVLCFDDALRSQYETALPLLKEYGFGATFFITEMEPSPRNGGFSDKTTFMTWDQIKAIEDAGFELGNHSLNHVFGSQNMGRAFNIAQIRGMEAEFEAHGLKKPVSYAYPSGISNPESVACARECGYLWGRGNEEKSASEGYRGMTYYDPRSDSPLAVCGFGDPDYYTEELLRQRISETPNGMVFGITYHDVSPETWPGPCPFERQMEVLKELGMEVISMSQLSDYIDPEKAYQYTTD